MDENCPICITTLNEPIKLNCGHIFCESCINSWLELKLPRHDLHSYYHHCEGFFNRFSSPLTIDIDQILAYAESLAPEARARFQKRFLAIYFQDIRKDMGLSSSAKLTAKINVFGITSEDVSFDTKAHLSLGEKRPESAMMTCPTCRRTITTICKAAESSTTLELAEALAALRSEFETGRLWARFITSVWLQVPYRLPERVQQFMEPLMVDFEHLYPQAVNIRLLRQ
ncbi:RING finger and transmembrane domain-containing protein 2 [Rhizina undulata]